MNFLHPNSKYFNKVLKDQAEANRQICTSLTTPNYKSINLGHYFFYVKYFTQITEKRRNTCGNSSQMEIRQVTWWSFDLTVLKLL